MSQGQLGDAKYFSVHGSDAIGWRLGVYQTAQADAVTPCSAPVTFDTFGELLEHLVAHYQGQGV